MKRKNTNTKPTTFVGVDIGKKWLDVSASRTSFRTSNTVSGHRKLVELSAKRGRRPHFICEPGSYGRKLVRFLRAQKFAYSIVSAYQVRQFAKARGREAKTDKIDAAMLSLFGKTFRPEPTVQIDPKLESLRRLIRRRQQIIEATKVQKHHLETMEGPALIRGAKPYRVVLVAVMRKLLVHLNAVVAAQDRAEPLPLGKTGQNQLA